MKESDEGWRVRQGTRDEGIVGKDLKVEKEDQRDRVMDKQRLSSEKEGSLVSQTEREVETVREEEQMEVTEEGQSHRDGTEQVEEKNMEAEEEGDTAVDQSENLILNQYQNPDPVLSPDAVKDSSTEPKPILGLISAPVQTPCSASLAAATPVPEVHVQSQRLPESHRDLHPVSQEDFCENMSTQSDNQSGTFHHKSLIFTVYLTIFKVC